MAEVHLTFDNGPHPEGTEMVLEGLRRRGLSASFFVLGKHLATKEGRRLAERIRDAGHRLGNHSFSHEIPLGDDPRPEAVHAELERTQQGLDAVWSGPRWFRPFGGGGKLGPHLLSPQSVDWLCQTGSTCVLWNSVPGDWLDPDGWVEPALEDLERLEQAVVVLHDILPGAMRHLDRYLDGLQAGGHTVSATLPAAVTPIVEGVRQPGLSAFVSRRA